MKVTITAVVLFFWMSLSVAWSHEGHVGPHAQDSHAQDSHAQGVSDSSDSGDGPIDQEAATQRPRGSLSTADAFKPFLPSVRVRENGDYLYVESSGLPSHNMMVGIRSWQQQVPLPQPFTGANAWRLPLKPKLAVHPVSSRTNLFRGAIALAVNGVPIFNALNNRGEDAFLAGELDDWGGHCGRGDDYHYHVAPVHLEAIVGKGNPIAFALDGFPIYGYTEADGSAVGKLDEFNGQFDRDGGYHYHATKTFPYINGGLRGEVSVRQGQVAPQPRDSPVRPAGQPLRGATVTGFSRTDNRFRLEYLLSGRKAFIDYTVNSDGKIDFRYEDPTGKSRTESYRRRAGETYLPRPVVASAQIPTDATDPNGEPTTAAADFKKSQSAESSQLIVSSPAFESGGELPIDFTGDGLGESPPIAWTQGPPGTSCYAISLWHSPPSGKAKSYWLLYDIPPEITRLPRQSIGIGTVGYNDKDRAEYDPMRSRGPGAKEYHLTVYALSKKPDWSPAKVTRDDLLNEIADITLAEGTLSFQYTRNTDWTLPVAAGLMGAIAAVFVFWFQSRKRHPSNIDSRRDA